MPTDVKLDQGPRGDTVLLEGNVVVTGDLILPALNTTMAALGDVPCAVEIQRRLS